MRVAMLVLASLLLAASCPAEQLDEAAAVVLLSHKKPLWLGAETKTAPRARVRLHFWVGKKGDVEAVEQACGNRELFDEIVDNVLEWKFRPREGGKSFTTDLSFVRRGRRVWLVYELPPGQRPRHDICE